MSFSLHPQLAKDTLEIGDLLVCKMLLMKDARFPWIILVPRVENMSEIFELGDSERQQVMMEISGTAARLKKLVKADKMNIAALGNQVPQLHIHVIARFKNDAAWPNPVWNSGDAVQYDDARLAALAAELKSHVLITS